MPKKLIFINSHPIQYFAPLYAYLNTRGLRCEAWYCSDKSIKGKMDREFGVNIKWDIPLLEGYPYDFFKNYGFKEEDSSRFFGLINPRLVYRLFHIEPAVIVVHGWNYLTHFLVLMLGRLAGHTVCIRNDMPYSHELLKTGFKQKIKRFGLKAILFPRIDYFCAVGKENKAFYKSYGIPDAQILHVPYAIDNARFRRIQTDPQALRLKYGIAERDKVIVFSAKYIPKKRPLDLLQAFRQLNRADCWLVLVGDGQLRGELEAYIEAHQLKQVILTGFINQSEIPNWYALGDVFVMCSGQGENWGLSVNEAMNFNLNLVLSDLTGCASDLVRPGANGFVFKTGDVAALTDSLDAVLYGNALAADGITSLELVDEYDFEAIYRGFKPILQ
ncbi:MAG: hypothetical protein COA80_02540 [Leeuwenhoekiella sp.]|nr:MAG: hypothetical protein COA80_02540 [Leeuwenhoekiella sp.]